MKITVNGKVLELPENTRLTEFLETRKVKREGVIAELNEKVMTRDLWAGVVLAEGDRLELISLVGGG